MTLTLTSSLLTAGLNEIPATTPVIQGLVDQLLTLEKELQDAHTIAKQDSEKGEEVLQLYVQFRRQRDVLIDELKKRNVIVPWQLRVKIDEFEQSLKEREKTERPRLKDPSPSSIQVKETNQVSSSQNFLVGFLPFAIALLAVIIAVGFLTM